MKYSGGSIIEQVPVFSGPKQLKWWLVQILNAIHNPKNLELKKQDSRCKVAWTTYKLHKGIVIIVYILLCVIRLH